MDYVAISEDATLEASRAQREAWLANAERIIRAREAREYDSNDIETMRSLKRRDMRLERGGW